MIILQIAPEFDPGTGVGSVVHHLEREWIARGHDVRRLNVAGGSATSLGESRSGHFVRLRHAGRVMWSSTVGTVVARRAVRSLPDGAISICHNDALAGAIYVNHGVLQTAMRARGQYWQRMVRNPVHLFTAARDRIRYQGTTHLAVVNLTFEDDRALRDIYPRLRPPTRVIGNGVDTQRFRPASHEERCVARAKLSIPDDALVTVFVGNEYERKGLGPLLEAIARAGEKHHIVVVGGSPSMTAKLGDLTRNRGINHRSHIVGKQDPLPYLWAADLLAQPSAYESYGLVVAEALAAGVPVMSTRVGVAPDLVESGVNGYLTDGTPEDMLGVLERLEQDDRQMMRSAARESAVVHSWDRVAETYLSLFSELVDAGVK